MSRAFCSTLWTMVIALILSIPAHAQSSKSKRERAAAQAPQANAPSTSDQSTATKPPTAVGFFGRAGGKLSVTAADGTRYDLDIPKNALPWGERIAMTVVPRVSGLPDYMVEPRGVEFSPSGLQFVRDAWLTVTPSKAPPPGTAPVLLSVSAGGATPEAQLFRQVGNSLRVPVSHFSELWYTSADDRITQYFEQIGKKFELDRALAPLRHQLALERQRQLLGQTKPDEFNDLVKLLTQQAIDRVLGPLLLSARVPGANCDALRAPINSSLEVERSSQLAGQGDNSPFEVLRSLMERANAICEDEALRDCWTSGNATAAVTEIVRNERQRQLLGTGGETEGLYDRVANALEKLMPCMRYEVTVSTKQENQVVAPKHKLLHHVKVDDVVSVTVEAKFDDLVNDQGEPVKEEDGSIVRKFTIRKEGQHWPVNYVYDFKDVAGGTCFTRNAAVDVMGGDPMVVDLRPVGETKHLIRIKPGSINQHWTHWTCSLPKMFLVWDTLWAESFLAANEALKKEGWVEFPVPRRETGYPEIGNWEFSGKGVNKKSSPELEDFTVTQTTKITIVHKPKGSPPPALEQPPARKPLPSNPKADRPIPL